ncbi:hypothetical protein QJS66_19545 [Kocuria rhizophila]|nr:hypothetical protein QJS66_19545 [Kocuria rhizophila]
MEPPRRPKAPACHRTLSACCSMPAQPERGDAGLARQRGPTGGHGGARPDRFPYYRRHYQGLPATITDPQLLPITTKAELMAHFNEWVTDPAVTLADVEAFVADPALIGHQLASQLHRGDHLRHRCVSAGCSWSTAPPWR